MRYQTADLLDLGGSNWPRSVPFRVDAANCPVGALSKLTIEREKQIGARLERVDTSEQGLIGVVERAEHEEVPHHLVVRRSLDKGQRQESLDLRGKGEVLPIQRVIERLDPQPISRAEQQPPAKVDQSKRPHAVEPGKACLAPLLVRGQQNFGVRSAPEAIAEAFQLGAQLHVV